MPLAAVLERPQRTPPQSRLVVSVERLPWDSIVIDLGESARDGIVAPGADGAGVGGLQHHLAGGERSQRSHHSGARVRWEVETCFWRDEPREVVAGQRGRADSRGSGTSGHPARRGPMFSKCGPRGSRPLAARARGWLA